LLDVGAILFEEARDAILALTEKQLASKIGIITIALS